MDWEKGKNRLIILFFCINLLLGWANYRKEVSAHVLKDSSVQGIKTVLETNNIFLDAQLPKNYKPIQKLTVSPFQMNSGIREDFVKKLLQSLDGVTVSVEPAKSPESKPRRIYRRGEEVVVFEGENILYKNEANVASGELDIDKAKKMADRLLTQLDYSPRKMHMQLIQDSNIGYIVYYDMYNDIPIFDSYVKIMVTSSGISEVEIHKVELGEAIGEKQEIYPSDQVFFYLMKTLSSDKPTHIKDIMIGYALDNPKGTHLIAEKALPFYQIILDDGRVYYINAYNSEIREE